MASSDQSKCSTDDTEAARAACCSPCSDEGSYTAAGHYCVDCELYFCGKCVKFHNKLSALKSHQVNDIKLSDLSEAYDNTTGRTDLDLSSETLRCTLHQDKPIDTHCKDHGEVCCATCALISHRSCSTESIERAAKDFKSSPELNTCKEALSHVIDHLKQEIGKRTGNIDRIGGQKIELIECVDKYEERIIAKVKELANNSREEIRSKYEENKTVLDLDVETLQAARTTSVAYVDKLEQTDNELLLFATAKTSKKVARDGEMLLEAMGKEWVDRELKFHLDKTLEKSVEGMETLGQLVDDCAVKEYEATFQKNATVNSNVNIFDMCLMDTGDLLLTDLSNFKLIRYSSDLQYKDEIKLSIHPIAVCRTDTHEAAVRMWNTKVVHFVSVGQSMKLTYSFTLDANGYGMTYDVGTEEIFACEENKVSVYSKTGKQLRTFDKDTNDEPIFSQCRQIALSKNKRDVYVTDYQRGVIVLDNNGLLKMKVSPSGIGDVWPLCLLPGNIFLTGSVSSGVIVQFEGDGKQVGTLIDTKDERQYTRCAVYDRAQSRLLVGGYPGVISVYTLCAK